MQPHQNPYAQPQHPGQQPQHGHPAAGYPGAPAAPVAQPGQHVPGAPYAPAGQQGWPQQPAQPQAQPQPQAWPQQQPAPAQHAQPQPQAWGQQPQAQPQQAWGQQPQAQPQQQAWGQQPQAHQQQQAWGQQPQQANPYAPMPTEPADDPTAMAADVSTAARSKFIERTYMHLALAISVFVVLSAVAQNVPGVEVLVGKMIGHRYSWGVVLALFMGAGYVADKWAAGDSSTGMQYMGLLLYTVAEVVIFIPLIFLVKSYVGIEPILSAGAATLAVFAGLTAYVFITKKDFSFMKGTLTTIAMASLGLIIASIVWGFHLGMVFSAAMIVLGAGYILYYTSNIQKHYRTDQHVAAALALFSALAFVFWYVLRIVLSMARN